MGRPRTRLEQKAKGNISKTRDKDACIAHQIVVSGRYSRFGWRRGVAILLVLGGVRVYSSLTSKNFCDEVSLC